MRFKILSKNDTKILVELYHENSFIYEVELLISKAFIINSKLTLIGHIHTCHECKMIYCKEHLAPITKDKNKVDIYSTDTLTIEKDKALCKQLSSLVAKEFAH